MTQKQLVIFAVECAFHVLKIYEKEYPNDKRPRDAIKAARNWIKNPTSYHWIRPCQH